MRLYFCIFAFPVLNLFFSPSAFAQPTCSEDCLKEWFKQRFSEIDLSPPEIQADFLLRQCSLQADRDRKTYLLSRVQPLLAVVPEEVPVFPLIGYTDSLPGEAARALGKGLSRMSLEMRFIRILAGLDLDAAAVRWREFSVPLPSPERYIRGEGIDFGDYYRTAFHLFDLLQSHNQNLQANLLLLRAVDSINSSESLVSLHDVLGKRLSQALVSDLMLGIYIGRLSRLTVKTTPELTTWLRIVYFWKLLLSGEASTKKLPLLEAIRSFVDKASGAENLNIRFRVETNNGEKMLGGFWPAEARTHWIRMTAGLKYSELEQSAATQIEKAFDSAIAGQTQRELKILPMMAYWANPSSSARFDSLMALLRSRRDLQPAGFWEPQLASFLAELRKDLPGSSGDQLRLLNYLEKAYVFRSLFAMSDYMAAPKGSTFDLPPIN